MMKSEFLEKIITALPAGVVLDPSASYPEPEYTLKTEKGVKFGARGNLMAINGKSKAGKSFFIAALIASWLGWEGFDFRTFLAANERIVFADTDQARSYQMRMYLRVARLLGCLREDLAERLIFLNIREKTAAERLEIILKAMDEIRPSVFIIDNVAHLVGDYNDPKESFRIMDMLKALASKYLSVIVLTIHQNKNDSDKNMKGHLGTNIVQDASDVFAVELKDGQRRVTHQYSRDMPIPDFTFKIVNSSEDNFALPELCPSTEMLAQQRREEEKARNEEEERRVRWKTFHDILDNKLPMTKKDLAEAYQKMRNVGRTKAYEDISLSLEDEYLMLTDYGTITINNSAF